MKLAIVKPFRRISSIPRDSLNFSSELNKMIINFMWRCGHSVDIWTHVSENDDTLKCYGVDHGLVDSSEYSTINDRDYDALIVITSSPNFYGGVVDHVKTSFVYKMINEFNGPVILYIDDAALILTPDITAAIDKKSSEKYDSTYTKISKKLNILTTFNDFSTHRKNGLNINKEIYFPMEKMFLASYQEINKHYDKQYDVMYGGALKPSRNKYFKKYFFDNPSEIKTQVFSNYIEKQFNNFMKLKDTSAPEVLKVSNNNFTFFRYNQNKGLTSIIFGDFAGDNKIIPLRIYQTLNAGSIQLVDIDFDRNKEIFKDKELQDLVYISSKEEMIEKIKIIREMSPIKFFSIIEKQYEAIKLDYNEIFKELNRKLYEAAEVEYNEEQICFKREIPKLNVCIGDIF